MPDVTQLRHYSNSATAGYSKDITVSAVPYSTSVQNEKKLAVQKLYSNEKSEQPNTTKSKKHQ